MDDQKLISNKKTIMVRIIKIAAFSLVLCLMMYALLLFQTEKVPGLVEELEKEDMPNWAWLTAYGTLFVPSVLLCVLLTLFYSGEAYEKINTQKDKAIVIAVVALFTYLVLFTSVISKSRGWDLPVPDGEEDVKSALELSVGWFSVQVVPFLIILSYHLIKASSEKKELAENEQ